MKTEIHLQTIATCYKEMRKNKSTCVIAFGFVLGFLGSVAGAPPLLESGTGIVIFLNITLTFVKTGVDKALLSGFSTCADSEDVPFITDNIKLKKKNSKKYK